MNKRRRTVRISYRRCRQRDLLPALRLILTSLNDLRRRRGKSPFRGRPRKPTPTFQHLFETDPESFYCAWHGEKLVGFGAAINRGRHWYLSWMFVHPRYQGLCIGRKLMDKVWRDGRGVIHSVATFTHNMQAVGLYSSFGMLPDTLLTLMGAPTDKLSVPPSTGLRATPELARSDWAWINRLEARIRGFAHLSEWRFWRQSSDHQIWLFKDRGRRVGYCMFCRGVEISPIGATSPEQLLRVVAESIRLGVEQASRKKKPPELLLACPDKNRDLYRFLLDAGFRNKEMFLFMTDRLEPDFQCYLPAMLAIY